MRFQDYERAAAENDIGKGGDYFKLEVGDNKVRILSGFEALNKHWLNAQKKSFICVGKDNCQYCREGVQRQVKFLMWVLDRRDSEVKLAEVPYSVIRQLGELAATEEWAFDEVPHFDVTIRKKGEGKETEYTVLGLPPIPKPLTADEQEKANEKVKDINEIISKMIQKAGGEPTVIHQDEDGEITQEDIPF